jgi:hypothetical protein
MTLWDDRDARASDSLQLAAERSWTLHELLPFSTMIKFSSRPQLRAPTETAFASSGSRRVLTPKPI